MNRSRRGERGQGIIEFAVIFPVFIFFVFVMIDGGLTMGRYNQLNHAAQEGARLAATGASRSEVVAHVRDQSNDVLDSSVQANCTNHERICVQWYSEPNSAGEVGSYVKVEIFYEYYFQTPLAQGLFGIVTDVPDHLHLSSCAIARLERPVDPPSGATVSGTPSC
jgi:hypothetical protein